MAVLTAQQRNILEKAVIKARKTAEEGAINSLKNLAVDQPEPFQHQSPEQRALRNNLRAKARLLGDIKLPNGSHEMQNLAYDLAYEYWHKILFARFLEANNLLMHPTMGVAVTLEEIEELAPEEGYADKWDAAATYASKMLPAIFRVNDPLMQVKFSPDDRIALESILNALEPEIFTADDALGWVYQFWQNEAKAAINASQELIDGERLPSVSQLFTEPYMVHFLIDNTIGAWWTSKNPSVKSPVRFDYLRFSEKNVPISGKYESWPEKTAELTTLDPCMGSGHFVASLFIVLAQLRMFEEKLSAEGAADKVISENLYGLELDPRCTQIAAFNLAITAWRFIGKYHVLPNLNLACSGSAPKGKKSDWLKLVSNEADENQRQRLEKGIEGLYDLFQLAPELGSLLNPSAIKSDLYTASYDELIPFLEKALTAEGDEEVKMRGVFALGISNAAKILSKKYSLIFTNVPFLGSKGQSDFFKDYFEEHYKLSKYDLANVMFERILKLLVKQGECAIVIPQNWLFTKYFEGLRKSFVKKHTIGYIAKLGPGAFECISGEVVNVCLINTKLQAPVNTSYNVIDVTGEKSIPDKINGLYNFPVQSKFQSQILSVPKCRIAVDSSADDEFLSKYAEKGKGSVTGDRPHYLRCFWELDTLTDSHYYWLDTPSNKMYSGRHLICIWNDTDFNPSEEIGFRNHGQNVYDKIGIFLGKTNQDRFSVYLKSDRFFDDNVAIICPKDEKYFLPIYAFVDSGEYSKLLSSVDERIAVTAGSFVDVVFDYDYWKEIANQKYLNGLPQPYSDDPTQWLFHGHPVKAENALQVAVARLLGYRWPAESDEEMELSEEARELIQQVKELELPFDEDGIVCIPPVYSEQPAAERLRQLLQKAWVENWNNSVVADLLKQAGSNKTNLEDWLRDDFFANHCKVFQNRPFIWHIWDGRKDGFSALVNYHKLDKETLKKLIYTYLGDWIRQCEAKKKSGESGADGLLSAALKLKEKLELILVGEQPYDIFVRWKKLEEQPIGWEPNLNDGVRLNIRPFVEAGVLRSRFNIKWGIDRGKNPAGSPWGEIRDNDRHLSLEEKRKVRQK